MEAIEKIVGYKYRIYPNCEQVVALSQLFGCVRYVYNWGLSLRREHYRETGESINSYDLSKILTEHKRDPDFVWLNDVLRMPLRIALFHLDTAYKNFFEQRKKRKRVGKPRYKKKQNRQSATVTYQYFNIDDNRKLNIHKIPGSLKIRWSRYWASDATVKSVTVSKDTAGRYFVSFLVSEEVTVIDKIGDKIGIDAGLTHFLTTSDGIKIENPKYFQKLLAKYRRLSRNLSRKKKGSNNREKARIKMAKTAVRIADLRKDFQHKLSTRLTSENQAVGIESLSVEEMLRNGSKQLSRSIADASWSTFLTMLVYKGNWYGCDVVPLPEYFPSSKTCSSCGYVVPELPLSARRWTCSQCDTEHDRDINAAINIRNHTVGETGIDACGDTVRPQQRYTGQASEKQELSMHGASHRSCI